ncbi:MAG: SDR family oxidoreductase [Myxococcota bacterium]|jgi:NAD(P)-dependent dehydrogenase (short-subunit alcohol dehydrogenase family)|nr:SDR family oxidoreductase [Myxococcota bacterium]
MNIRGTWAWITGAAGGLGGAIALELAGRGANLVLTDLTLQAVEPVAVRARGQGVQVVCLVQDVTDRARWEEIAHQLETEGRLPRMLVNNAGVAAAGLALETPDQAWRTVIEIDLWGVIHGCRALVPRMLRTHDSSAVLNVASAAAHMGLPFGAAYSVAKAGVFSLTQSLRLELDSSRVSFTCVCPGSFDTGIWSVAARLGDGPPELIDQVGALVDPSGRAAMAVARRAVAATLAGRAVVNVFWESWVLDLAARVLPHQWLSRVFRYFFVRRFPSLACSP